MWAEPGAVVSSRLAGGLPEEPLVGHGQGAHPAGVAVQHNLQRRGFRRREGEWVG